MRWWLLLLLLVACQPNPACDTPYSLIGQECCLDKNNNGVCDRDDPAPEMRFEELRQQQGVVNDSVEVLPIDRMLTVVDDRVSSYSYITPFSQFDGATYFVRGDRVRVDLHDPVSLRPGEYVDLIIFNRSARTATGYCRHFEHICRDTFSESYDLPFDHYWEPTPLDRLRVFAGKPAERVKEESEIVEDRWATRFVFAEPDGKTTVWVDAHYGVPLRIRESQGRVYTYESLAVNTVKEEMFHAFNVRPRRG